QVEHLTRIVDDLLDLSRISRGQMRLLKEPVNATLPIRQAVEAIQPLARERGLTLSVSLPAKAVYIEADPTRIQQVVDNLLTNAIKFTDPGGNIILKAHDEGGDLVLQVRDTGIGIPADMLSEVFDLFVQATRRLERSQGGLGLGLTLVRRLVEMHGGTVAAHSEGPGKGAEFVVRLPTLPKIRQEELHQSQNSRPRPVARSPSRRVLVVDDNVDAAETLASLLRLEGHKVRVAYDGTTALAAAAESTDIVILDLGMPLMDGFEVARRLRKRLKTKDCLLVAISGWARENDRRRCCQAGFDGHLPKPVELDELRQFFIHPR